MTLELEKIISFVSLIVSIIAMYFVAKKSNSEVDNNDADTLSTLFDTLDKQDKFYKNAKKEQECQYAELKKEFENYKIAMNTQMAYLQSEAARLRNWAERLSRQLKDNGIQPEPF